MQQSSRQQGSNVHRVVVAVVLLALVSVAAISFYVTWSRLPAPPVLFPPLSTPDKSIYVISGMADPGVEVLVKVPNSPDLVSNADASGIFHTLITLPQGGDYNISAHTKNRQGKTSQPQSFRIRVKENAPPVQISRNVVMLAKFRGLAGYVEAVLPRTQASWLLQESDITDPAALSNAIKDGKDPVSTYLRTQLSKRTAELLSSEQPSSQLLQSLVTDLRWMQANSDWEGEKAFSTLKLSEATEKEKAASSPDPTRVNRMLLEDAYPNQIAKVSDRPGYKLVTESQNCSDFVKEIFSEDTDIFEIREANSEHFVSSDELFESSATRQVLPTPSFVVVRCLSRPKAVGDHLLSNNIVFETKWKSFSETRDTFSIVTRDYSLTSFSDPPMLSSPGYALWMFTNQVVKPGTASEADEDAKSANTEPIVIREPRNIAVNFRYHPLERPENLLKLARLTPYELVSSFRSNPWALVTFALTILFAIPILWIDYLFRHDKAATIRLLLLLVALFIPSVFSMANGVAGGLYRYNPYNVSDQSTELPFMIPALVLVGLACCGLFLALRFVLQKESLRRGLSTLSLAIPGAVVVWALLLWGVELLKTVRTLGGTAVIVFSTVIALLSLIAAFLLWRPSLVSSIDGSFRHSLTKYVLVLLILFVFAYPFSPANIPEGTGVLRNYVQSFFSAVLPLLPYLALALLLRRLNKYGCHTEQFVFNAGLVLFSAYVVGSTANWMVVPIPFLLSLWIYQRHVLVPADGRRQINEIRSELLTTRNEIIERAFSDDESQLLQQSLASIRGKFASGELAGSEFEKQKEEIEKLLREEKKQQTFANGIAKKEAMLNFGPLETDWENALSAVRVSLILVAPFFFLELWRSMMAWEPGPYSYLTVLVRALAQGGNWLVAAFLFGYFFPYIQGENGLKKSIRISLGIILSLLPIWLILAATPSAVILRSIQTIFFFAFLGTFFDYYTVSSKVRSRSDWEKFVRLVNVPTLTALTSSFIGLVGLGLTAALTGEFKSLFSQAVEITVKQLPTLQLHL